MSQGVFCLIHFDEEDPVDTGPTPSSTFFTGHAVHDPLDGAFSDPLGCASFPQQLDENGNLLPPESYPAADLRKIATFRDLEFNNDSFVVEMRIKFSSLTGLQQLASYWSPAAGLGWAITVNFTQSNQTIDFSWIDHHGDNRNFSIILSEGLFTEGVWHHFVFQYSKTSEWSFVWIDGQLAGSFLGPTLSDPQQRRWDGIYIQTLMGSVYDPAVNGFVFDGQPLYFSVGGPENTLKGAVDEIRVINGYFYHLDTPQSNASLNDISVPTTPYDDFPPPLIPEDLNSIEISKGMMNDIITTRYEEPRYTPALVKVNSSLPTERATIQASPFGRDPALFGYNEGTIYVHQPRPDFPLAFLYVLYNIQGEGETPILRWVPVNMPKLGKINTISGSNWKNRKGFKLGEPF